MTNTIIFMKNQVIVSTSQVSIPQVCLYLCTGANKSRQQSLWPALFPRDSSPLSDPEETTPRGGQSYDKPHAALRASEPTFPDYTAQSDGDYNISSITSSMWMCPG